MEDLRVSNEIVIQSHKGPYNVYFEENALANLNENVPEYAHFIIDKKVAELYKDEMKNILAHRSVLLIEAKETNKSLDKFPDYVQHFVNNSLRRDNIFIAIGGGIIQDITCFLAATMLRGVDWRFYPTTLLAQSDSCIGSKSSINAGNTKNILGTFTPPKAVYISGKFLDTLEEKELLSGVGEMLKVHVIDGAESYDLIADEYDRIFKEGGVMLKYIRRSLEIKKRYIEKDEFDQNIRNIFNYGHTFGHAIEAATNFGIPHGIAVTIGMDMANYTAMKMGITREQHFQRMHASLKKNYSSFSQYDVPLDSFLSAISKDKKNVGVSNVTLILVDEGAKVFKNNYPNDETFKTICNNYLTEIRQQ